jgi:hypothetical protein
MRMPLQEINNLCHKTFPQDQGRRDHLRRLLDRRISFTPKQAIKIVGAKFGGGPGGNVGLETDTSFQAGRGNQSDAVMKKAHAKAKAKGKSTSGFYSHQLGEFVQGKADIERICLDKGYGVEGGGMNIKPAETVVVEKDYEVCDRVVEDRLDRININEHGGEMTTRERNDMRAGVKKSASGNRGKIKAVV